MDEYLDIADFDLDGKVDDFEAALLFNMMEEEDQEIERLLRGKSSDDDTDEDLDDLDDDELDNLDDDDWDI